ncbi:aminoglycoside N(3)-acetyltransferase [Phaeacidiphilus oryzae]|jgi:aminoglycoside 3-N-acetyltransferase|uniref:aminoglycoside N(3)-acetyltransferase n=1 Tax=Phaeacidiphilus oryzae TaxID=348818 RepID=UPI00055D56DC|nr:AAC(3) family N-acetyltransferase [Phaeacidiphilus oryzae]
MRTEFGRLPGERELAAELAELGVRPGGVLLVQSSMRALGVVSGGVDSAIAALRAVLGPEGTLVVYTATDENSTTSRAHRSRIRHLTERQASVLWDRMPPYDPERTPASPTLGVLSERVRRLPGALRSAHPQTSFAAIGPQARRITEGHALTSHLGERSPLARLYELDAQNLLVGVGLEVATALHLAEYRRGGLRQQMYSCKVLGPDGRPRWVSFTDAALDDLHFPEWASRITPHLRTLRPGRVASARALLVGVRDLVDTAVRVGP